MLTVLKIDKQRFQFTDSFPLMLVRHLTDTCNVMHKEDAYFNAVKGKE
jgi:hypothetical protein